MAKQPDFVFLGQNMQALHAIHDGRVLSWEATALPIKCRELVVDWPNYIGVKDALVHGVGGIIVGENKEYRPTVFCIEWHDNIKADLVTTQNPKGQINDSDLEMARPLFLFSIMEQVRPSLLHTHYGLFSDNPQQWVGSW